MKIILKWVICLCCCFWVTLYAGSFPQKTLSFSVGIGQPITTATADTLDKGEFDVSERLEYYSNNSLSNEVLLQHPQTENQQASLTNYWMLFYGIHDDITIGTSIPFADNISISGANINQVPTSARITQLGSAYGLGDTNFFAMWRLLNETQYPLSVSFLSGFSAPTGKTTARDSNGSLFSAADQPGTGAWIPLSGIRISKQFTRFSLSANVTYAQGMKGIQDTILGSIFDYNFATVVELYHNDQAKLHVNGILEFNGEYVAQDNISGVNDPNSGGNTIYLLPGFRVNIDTDYSFYLGINIPIEQNFYGTQVTNQYGITGGIDISI